MWVGCDGPCVGGRWVWVEVAWACGGSVGLEEGVGWIWGGSGIKGCVGCVWGGVQEAGWGIEVEGSDGVEEWGVEGGDGDAGRTSTSTRSFRTRRSGAGCDLAA